MIPTCLAAMTGRIRAGKDHTAHRLGLEVLSIADPMYEICHSIMGGCDKTNPLHRRFLQLVGAWGRNMNPLPPEGIPSQAEMTQILRSNGNKHTPKISQEVTIPWEDYGKHEAFWIDIMRSRVLSKIQAGNPRIAIPNIRLPLELEAFQRLGFLHLHITCSEETIQARRQGDNCTINDNDITEVFSKQLDATMLGPQVIWNDENFPPPPDRGYTPFTHLTATT